MELKKMTKFKRIAKADLEEFETSYKVVGEHRKKCHSYCGKLIKDGERVLFKKKTTEKSYPVKGLMKFTTWHASHLDCIAKSLELGLASHLKHLKENVEMFRPLLPSDDEGLLKMEEEIRKYESGELVYE